MRVRIRKKYNNFKLFDIYRNKKQTINKIKNIEWEKLIRILCTFIV